MMISSQRIASVLEEIKVDLMHEHRCLVCGYEGDLDFYPRDYMICGCCGTEFGYDDRVLTHSQLRQRWIQNGFPWFDEAEPRPVGWDPYQQLNAAGFYSDAVATFNFANLAELQAVQLRYGDASIIMGRNASNASDSNYALAA